MCQEKSAAFQIIWKRNAFGARFAKPSSSEGRSPGLSHSQSSSATANPKPSRGAVA
jgi:hypothetical protein